MNVNPNKIGKNANVNRKRTTTGTAGATDVFSGDHLVLDTDDIYGVLDGNGMYEDDSAAHLAFGVMDGMYDLLFDCEAGRPDSL